MPSDVEEVKHENLTFQVWDLGGQEPVKRGANSFFRRELSTGESASQLVYVFRGVGRAYTTMQLRRNIRSVQEADAIIFVVDSNDQERQGLFSTARRI